MHIKTRFAPSPTGEIHLGNLRTALFNLLYARACGGSFLLRIEDTDKERSKRAYIDSLLQELQWLGVQWEEGPFYQSERDAIYQDYYKQLEAAGLVYPCYCTEVELGIQRKVQLASGQAPRYPGTCRHLDSAGRAAKVQEGREANLRFRVPEGRQVVFEDLVYGPKAFHSEDLGDFVVRKADGGPTFIFCNAVDDALMGVTHALRGEDHLTNTPRQLLVLEALGLVPPAYAHLPIILGADGKPLSKRNGSQSIMKLREAGYLPEAILNYIARLGHHTTAESLLSLEALAAQFSLDRIGTAPAHFDIQQMQHWQKAAILAMPLEKLPNWLAPALALVPTEKHSDFMRLMQENISFVDEAKDWALRYFGETLSWDDAQRDVIQTAGQDFYTALAEIVAASDFDASTVVKALEAKTGKKGKALFMPLRCALTGTLHGAQLSDIFALMGHAKIRSRVAAVLVSFSES